MLGRNHIVGLGLLAALLPGLGLAEEAAVTPAAVASEATVVEPAAEAVGTPQTPLPNLKLGDSEKKVDTITVLAHGYGAPPKKYYPEGQRKLMAMRAAKLDAYRALAERIQGLRIWGGTTIGDMVVEKDQFQVMLDAFVQGARILSVTPGEDGNYEAVIEAVIDQEFLRKAVQAQAQPAVVQMPLQTAQQTSLVPELPIRNQSLFEDEVPPNFYFSSER